jgi:head-tail adaptor
MKAGRLAHLLTFRLKTQALDDINAPIDGNWADAFTVPCEKVSESSHEFENALKRNAEITALFRIRYQAGIDSNLHEAVFCLDPDASPANYQTFDIDPPVDPTGRRIELLISGREVPIETAE